MQKSPEQPRDRVVAGSLHPNAQVRPPSYYASSWLCIVVVSVFPNILSLLFDEVRGDPKTAPPTEPTTPHEPNCKSRDRVGSSGGPHPEEVVSPLLHLRRPREGAGTGGTRERSRQLLAFARPQYGVKAIDSVSPAADGGPEYGPVARGASGEKAMRRKHGGAGSNGSGTGGGPPHLRSQSGPELPSEQAAPLPSTSGAVPPVCA